MASISTGTHLGHLCVEKNSQVFIIYFKYKLFDTPPQFLLCIDFTGRDLRFKINTDKNPQVSSQVSLLARKQKCFPSTNQRSRIIFGEPLLHFATVTWRSTAVLNNTGRGVLKITTSVSQLQFVRRELT
jgi:hypothetical protein